AAVGHLLTRLTDDPDPELLARFVATRDESAFAALIRRHGPMVLGVCRRLVRDAHRAQDAFQAAVLVLARKASPLRPGRRPAGRTARALSRGCAPAARWRPPPPRPGPAPPHPPPRAPRPPATRPGPTGPRCPRPPRPRDRPAARRPPGRGRLVRAGRPIARRG